MKKIILISILALLPIVSFAAIGFEKNSNGVVLTTSNNVYVAGSMVKISSEKQGDVYAAGGTIFVNENVNQDLVAAGGNIFIASQVVGDLRLVGGNINISDSVFGELVAAGGQIEIAPSSVINGDFIIAAGMISIDGSMNGNGKVFGDEVNIAGVLNKDISVKAKRLVINDTAVINGNINYQGSEEATVKDGAKINGKIVFTKIEMPKMANRAGRIAAFNIFCFIKLFATLVASLVLFFLMKRNIPKILGETMKNFWKEMLRGFAIFILVPAAVIILLITIIGSVISVFGIAFYVLSLVLAGAFSGILAAELLNRLVFRKSEKSLNWPMVILGVVVMDLLVFIPVIGWIVKFAIFLVALGVISNLIFRKAKFISE